MQVQFMLWKRSLFDDDEPPRLVASDEILLFLDQAVTVIERERPGMISKLKFDTGNINTYGCGGIAGFRRMRANQWIRIPYEDIRRRNWRHHVAADLRPVFTDLHVLRRMLSPVHGHKLLKAERKRGIRFVDNNHRGSS